MIKLKNNIRVKNGTTLEVEIKAQFDVDLIRFEDQSPEKFGQKIILPTKFPKYKITYLLNGQEIHSFNFFTYDLLLTNAMGFIISDLRSTKSEIEFYTTIVDQDFSITKLEVTIFSCKGELDFNFKENDLVFARYQGVPKENLKSRKTFYSEREIINN